MKVASLHDGHHGCSRSVFDLQREKRDFKTLVEQRVQVGGLLEKVRTKHDT